MADRVRLIFEGCDVGDFDEPCCVLGPLSQHLVTLCATADALWPPSLARLAPSEQFAVLDRALFRTYDPNKPRAFGLCGFLTNVPEAFDGVKGFLLSPPGELFHALLLLNGEESIRSFVVPRAEFCAVAAEFASWVKEQEHALQRGGV